MRSADRFYAAKDTLDWKHEVLTKEREIVLKSERIKCMEDLLMEKDRKIKKLEDRCSRLNASYDSVKKKLTWFRESTTRGQNAT